MIQFPNSYSASYSDAFLCRISVTFVDKDGEEKQIEVPVGMSMLEAAHENDIELEGKNSDLSVSLFCLEIYCLLLIDLLFLFFSFFFNLQNEAKNCLATHQPRLRNICITNLFPIIGFKSHESNDLILPRNLLSSHYCSLYNWFFF